MTHEQIDNLSIQGREYFLANRILELSGSEWIHPDSDELDGEGSPIKDTSFAAASLPAEFGVKPSEQDLLDELEVYKAELRAEEDARLAEIARLNDLKQRFEDLFDQRMAMGGRDISNPAAYFRDEIYKCQDKAVAEQKMQELESADQAFKVEYEASQAAQPLEDMKVIRDKKLFETDFTQLADAPLTSEQKGEYRNYRQHLRDLPQKIANQQKLDYVVPTFAEWKAGAI